MITAKKMPQALRRGANPPFQRVEETRGALEKTLGLNCTGFFVAMQQVFGVLSPALSVA
jgi:hypothetical protein